MEHGKPDKPHTKVWCGISTVRKWEGLAGIGCWKKRMPRSNSVDRVYYNEKVVVEDTQSERMLTSYAGINEKKVFSKFITIILSWVHQ